MHEELRKRYGARGVPIFCNSHSKLQWLNPSVSHPCPRFRGASCTKSLSVRKNFLSCPARSNPDPGRRSSHDGVAILRGIDVDELVDGAVEDRALVLIDRARLVSLTTPTIW
jgi:hypothetical protein